MEASRKTPAAQSAPDAVALLKADHQQVKAWFEAFEKATSAAKRKQLATDICNALMIHTEIEEEIFYPAFLDATRDKDKHHEAVVEQAGAKDLVAQIQASDPADDYYHSKVHVLFEMIKHHVNEEEKPGGMFAEAKACKSLDLTALGEKLAARKQALQAQMGQSG
jgi:hypothetical protein